MEEKKVTFEEKLTQLLELAKTKKNVLDNKEILNYFHGEILSPEQLDQIYTDLGLSGSSNLYLCSQEIGRMTEDEMQKVTADFLETMHAKKRNEIELQDTLCIYGYSDNVPEYVYQNDHKVNVNIAFTYDEAEDITYIHRGLPFIDKSF